MKKDFLTEAAMDGFSLEELKSIGSFKNKYNYCLQMLGKPIGRGSSRIVFQIDDEKVLKLAFNRKGIAQNEAESDWGMQQYGVVPILYEVDDDYMYIITEFVLQAKKEDFLQVLGITFEEFCWFVRMVYYQYDRRPPKLSNEEWDKFNQYCESSDWLNQLNTFMSDYQLPFGDLTRLANIGLCQRNGEAEMVILDNGLNDEVYNNFYSRF